MTEKTSKRWWGKFRAPILSPMGLVMRALILAVAFGAVHLAGFREYVGIMTGTAARVSGETLPVLCGALYVILYVTAVVLVPVLLIGALMMWACLAAVRGSAGPSNR